MHSGHTVILQFFLLHGETFLISCFFHVTYEYVDIYGHRVELFMSDLRPLHKLTYIPELLFYELLIPVVTVLLYHSCIVSLEVSGEGICQKL